ncbi:hypothetical protein TNCV_3517281 [Trichonephila clavipes]|nr:hypothetical protein TNCV_3517281 [Trichonephila clavipes]
MCGQRDYNVFLKWPARSFGLEAPGLDNTLRWRADTRLEVGQSQAEVAFWLQLTRKWSSGRGIDSKQVVLSPGRSAKVVTEDRHLHKNVLDSKISVTEVDSSSLACS